VATKDFLSGERSTRSRIDYDQCGDKRGLHRVTAVLRRRWQCSARASARHRRKTGSMKVNAALNGEFVTKDKYALIYASDIVKSILASHDEFQKHDSRWAILRILLDCHREQIKSHARGVPRNRSAARNYAKEGGDQYTRDIP